MLNIFAKSSILDVWLGSKYSSDHVISGLFLSILEGLVRNKYLVNNQWKADISLYTLFYKHKAYKLFETEIRF